MDTGKKNDRNTETAIIAPVREREREREFVTNVTNSVVVSLQKRYMNHTYKYIKNMKTTKAIESGER